MRAAVPREARCLECDYRLAGLTEPRCPECGSGFDPSDARTFFDPRRRIQRTPLLPPLNAPDMRKYLAPTVIAACIAFSWLAEPQHLSFRVRLPWVLASLTMAIAMRLLLLQRWYCRIIGAPGTLVSAFALGVVFNQANKFPAGEFCVLFMVVVTLEVLPRVLAYWGAGYSRRKSRHLFGKQAVPRGMRRIVVGSLVLFWLAVLMPLCNVVFLISYPAFRLSVSDVQSRNRGYAEARRVGLFWINRTVYQHRGTIEFRTNDDRSPDAGSAGFVYVPPGQVLDKNYSRIPLTSNWYSFGDRRR